MKKPLCYVAAVGLALWVGVAAISASNKSQVGRNLNIFSQVYRELHENYVDTIDPNSTMLTAINAMLRQIDPYTEFYPGDRKDDLLSVSSGEYAGIGSVISKRDTSIVLVSPNWDSPARRAGVHHGDVLLEIDGVPLTAATDVSYASSHLKGRPGTDVKIKVRRPFVTDSVKEFTITRGTIKIDPVPYYGYIGDGVGYIMISTFSEKTARETADAVKALKDDPRVKSLIIDLRNNGGGIITGAVQVVGNFVPKGTKVVETRGREPRLNKTYKTTHSPIDTEIPIVVLINDGTASSAEILSGALQDLDRAVIVGERSYGKGLVQSVRPLPDQAYVKITTGRYYIPSGRLVQAVNYSHTGDDGAPSRIPDSLTNVFYTAAGRPVRDGGGITPDSVTPGSDRNSRLMYQLVVDYWIDDYANRVFNNLDSIPLPDAWKLPEGTFEDFKASVDTARFDYKSPYTSTIKLLTDGAREEGYLTDSIQAHLDALTELLRPDFNRDMDLNRSDIEDVIDDALQQRMFSESDRVRLSLASDPDVLLAVKLLSAPAEYKRLLTPVKAKK